MRYVTLGAARKVVCPRIHFDRDEQMLGMTTPSIDVDPWSIAFWSQITLVYGVGLSPLGPNCGLHKRLQVPKTRLMVGHYLLPTWGSRWDTFSK